MPEIDIDDIVCMEETHITVRGYRRRTTIPSCVFKFLELGDGDVIRWVATKDGTVFITKKII
jgi:bifunctional DNA-binding transcriptional regulator/antitoxin component of YhaV-PrlF toxin-antitoxin module